MLYDEYTYYLLGAEMEGMVLRKTTTRRWTSEEWIDGTKSKDGYFRHPCKSSVKKIQRVKPPLSGKNGGCPGLPKGENALKR